MSYQDQISQIEKLISSKGGTWAGIDPESVTRMRLQNRFSTGLDIARYTAAIMRKDMAAYDADPSNYTQSLGCWLLLTLSAGEPIFRDGPAAARELPRP